MRVVSCALAAAVVVTGLTATTAASARQEPARVGLVQVVRNSPDSLTLNWPNVAGAAAYEVEASTDNALTDRRVVATADRSKITVTGLDQGQEYCFQVRAVDGKEKGQRSQRSCKTTVVAQGAPRGAEFDMLTYNLCSSVCSDWERRRPHAVDLITSRNPDVIALQETANESGMEQALKGYTLAQYKSAKMLFFRTSRFSLNRAGYLELGERKRYAVWADLSDRDNGGKRVIFVSAHFASGQSAAKDAARRTNANALLAGIDRVNPNRYPVIHAGDFNSHKQRELDAPTEVFNAAGYWDAYDLAESLRKPNFNSANGFDIRPRTSNMYGAHLDHFWVNPHKARVTKWANVARFDGDLYEDPLPSNHNPIFATIVLN